MRYQIGATPEKPGPPISHDIFLVFVVIDLQIGAGFVIAGGKGRQRWLMVWDMGFVFVSSAYTVAAMPGYARIR